MEAAILWVVAAGLTEPVWVVAMKKYQVTKKLKFIAVIAAFMILGPAALGLAEGGGVSPSIAYSVWVSIGTVMTTLTGYRLYGDPAGAWRVLCIALILAGVVGLQFTGARHDI